MIGQIGLIRPLGQMVAGAWPGKWFAAGVAVLLDFLLPGQAARDMALSAGALIVLDTLTGVWAAVVSGSRVTSRAFSRVLTKLFGYGSVVAVCAAASRALPGAEGLQPAAASGVLGFVILTEGISILENVGRMGVKVPAFLKDWFKKAARKADRTDRT